MTEPRRLDPRVFPSETGWLLVLLAATVLVNAWSMAGWLADPSGRVGSGSDTWQSMMGLLAPGPAMYAGYAWLRVRRAEPLSGTQFDAAAKVISELASGSRTTPKPQLRLGRKMGAQAYLAGLPHKPYFVLGPELLSLCSREAPHRRVFEAVIRHELAHLRGGDLRWYQLATALRVTNVYSAAVVVFGVTLASSFSEASAGQLTLVTLRAAGLVLLAELIARAFLRVREHYADLHAAQDETDGLLAALRSSPESSTLRRWLRRHPSGSERSAVVEKPGILLASGPGQLFLGATTAGVMLVTLQDILLVGESSNPQETPLLAGVLVGLPLTLFTAFTIWRSAWHAAVTGHYFRGVVFGVALFTGLVIGSHLSPYSRASGFAGAGIPFAPSILLVIAVSTLGLCWWLKALGATRARVDPAAQRLDAFLFTAGLCASVVGMWLFAVVWTWAMLLIAIQLGCATGQLWAAQACASATAEIDVARSIGADYAFTLYSLLAVGLVTASLVMPKLLARRKQADTRRVAAITVTALAVVTALWQVDQRSAMPSPRTEFRLVLELSPNITDPPVRGSQDLETARRTRQSQDPDGQRRTLADFDCQAADPLLGHADPTLPLITCSVEGTEKYLLAPVSMTGEDLKEAVAGPSRGGAGIEITLTFTDAGTTRWADLTTRNAGQSVAILVDDVVLLAPRISGPVPADEPTVLSGTWSAAEARSLVALISGQQP